MTRGRLQRWLDAILAWAIPEGPLRADLDTLRRARLIVVHCLIMMVPLPITAVVVWLAGQHRTAWLVLCAVPSPVLIFPLLRRTGSVAVTGNAAILLTAAGLIAGTAVGGGVGSPGMIWFPLVPALAFLYVGKRSGIVWACAMGGVVVLFAFGRIVPSSPPEWASWLPFQQAWVTFFAIFFLTAIVWMFEALRTQALRAVAVVLLTPLATGESGLGGKVDATLTKPLRRAAFRRALARALEARASGGSAGGRPPAPQGHGEPAPAPPSPASANPENGAGGEPDAAEVAATTLRRTRRLLVAEDNLINQRIIGRQLARLSYAADVVANGREAVDALQRTPYDLVLMDCQMPELDGYQATAAIRRLGGAAGRTPIIAMTASALDGDRERCFAAGMDDFVTKPAEPGRLKAVIEAWLFGRHSAAADDNTQAFRLTAST